MAIPKYFEFFAPVLHTLMNGQTISGRDLYKLLADRFNLSDEDRAVYLPSGKQLMYVNRIQWALTYLRKAGLIVTPTRGHHVITAAGKSAYSEAGNAINLEYLERDKSFVEFKYGAFDVENTHQIKPEPPVVAIETPEESMETAFQTINGLLAEELLNSIMEKPPGFFERLVVQLLVKMGYGGAFEVAGMVVGRTNDEGIDGVIREDKLGFSSIYIQAKRWDPDKTIGRPEVQTFVGALAGQGATKGLFITTALFSKAAVQYAQNPGINTKVVLVDGKTLAKLMIENNVGVSSVNSYTIKKIDTDYFTEES